MHSLAVDAAAEAVVDVAVVAVDAVAVIVAVGVEIMAEIVAAADTMADIVVADTVMAADIMVVVGEQEQQLPYWQQLLLLEPLQLQVLQPLRQDLLLKRIALNTMPTKQKQQPVAHKITMKNNKYILINEINGVSYYE
jgi:hypothetical protein